MERQIDAKLLALKRFERYGCLSALEVMTLDTRYVKSEGNAIGNAYEPKRLRVDHAVWR